MLEWTQIDGEIGRGELIRVSACSFPSGLSSDGLSARLSPTVLANVMWIVFIVSPWRFGL